MKRVVTDFVMRAHLKDPVTGSGYR